MKRKVVEAPRRGRPPFAEVKMTPRSVRMSEEQWEKLVRLGGSEWIRKRIDAAK